MTLNKQADHYSCQSDVHEGAMDQHHYDLQAIEQLEFKPIAEVSGLIDCGHHGLLCSSCNYCNQAGHKD